MFQSLSKAKLVKALIPFSSLSSIGKFLCLKFISSFRLVWSIGNDSGHAMCDHFSRNYFLFKMKNIWCLIVKTICYEMLQTPRFYKWSMSGTIDTNELELERYFPPQDEAFCKESLLTDSK